MQDSKFDLDIFDLLICAALLQDPVVSDGASVHREDGGGL